VGVPVELAARGGRSGCTRRRSPSGRRRSRSDSECLGREVVKVTTHSLTNSAAF